MKTKVGINGFGRIGRNALKIAMKRAEDFEITAINDLTDPETLAHLFQYDSCYGMYTGQVSAEKNAIVVDGRKITVLSETDPAMLPWEELGVGIVLESTGRFNKRKGAEKHLKAGAKRVVLSAPGKDEDVTIVMGVNEDQYDPSRHQIISNASCTTNCLAPLAKVIDEAFGIEKGMMTTIHSYTNDQRILDQPHDDLRRARAAALSMIPTTTGAAKAVELVLPQLAGKLSGLAVRVPSPTVSLTDFVCILSEKADEGQVNEAFMKAALGSLNGILGVSEKPLVSVDFRGDSRSCIIDAMSTAVLEGNMLKVLSWYDNEWGYANRVIDLIEYIIKK